VIDPGDLRLDVEVDDDETARRLADWQPPDLSAQVRRESVRDKYVRLVSSALDGCVL
jgi:dihydroxy-acid dehydratase